MASLTPTRTTVTEARYRAIFESLVQQYEKTRNGSTPFDSLALVSWLGERRPQLAKRTWWLYKAATKTVLAARHKQGEDHHLALTALAEMTAAPCPKNTGRTASKKDKKLSQQDLLTLCLYLENRPGIWGERTKLWLLAGYCTGLRPLEWTQCDWTDIDGHKTLRVVNAKATNGRAHGTHRHIILAGWDQAVIDTLHEHILSLQTFAREHSYYTYYDNCRDAMYRASLACFPNRKKRPSLYSARHQFAADMKRQHPAQLAAALMGHSTDHTAQRLYAQSRHGEVRGTTKNVPPLPLALHGEVARIEISRDTQQLLAHLQQARAARPLSVRHEEASNG